MKNKITRLLLIAVLISCTAMAQDGYWKKQSTNRSTVNYDNLKDNSYHINSLNLEAFKNDLSSATLREMTCIQTCISYLLHVYM